MYDTLTIASLGLALPTQQIVFWTAVLLATTLGPLWIARHEGLDLSRLRVSQGLLAFFGLAGARLHFILNNPHFYDAHPLRAVLPWGGGMHMGGAFIGLLIGVPLVARWYRLPMAKLCDGTIVVTAFAYAGTRLGCLLGGCCFGSHCERAWAVTYPPGSMPFIIHQQAGLIGADATASLPVHPAQIYFLLAALFSGAVAIAVGRRKRYDGQVFWVGLLLLSATTALLEPFRALENHRAFWAGVPQLVWTELALTLVAGLGLWMSGMRHRRAGMAPPDASEALLGATGR
jgi:phosphatidylglycerol:prolipoprotein diacylglycerol transferase